MKTYLHYLRISFTAVCGVVAVLLMVLWVRSYREWDQLSIPIHKDWWIAIESIRGEFCGWEFLSPDGSTDGHWNVYTRPLAEVLARERLTDPAYEFGPNKGLRVSEGEVWVPQWMHIIFTGTLAVLPWITRLRRFSLRTLLLATTLVAVVLGLVVWMVR